MKRKKLSGKDGAELDESDIVTLLKATIEQWIADCGAADQKVRNEARRQLGRAKRRPAQYFPLHASALMLGVEPNQIFNILEQRVLSNPIRQPHAKPATRRTFGTPNRKRQEARAA